MIETKLKITGMTCEHCVRAVTKALKKVPGVEKADVTLTPGDAVVHGQADPEKRRDVPAHKRHRAGRSTRISSASYSAKSCRPMSAFARTMEPICARSAWR
ncbi:heavy metal transport/detoxification protein [Burkholderiales bacterium GJ-E10]|nr:heavy metal transport/detoxification protein [Burkholderiales bacterium GJ-E10]